MVLAQENDHLKYGSMHILNTHKVWILTPSPCKCAIVAIKKNPWSLCVCVLTFEGKKVKVIMLNCIETILKVILNLPYIGSPCSLNIV